jgi:hypothetical protein
MFARPEFTLAQVGSVLIPNIRLDCKGLLLTKTLAYYQYSSIMAVKSFIRKDCFQVKSNLLTDFRFTTHMNIMILN